MPRVNATKVGETSASGATESKKRKHLASNPGKNRDPPRQGPVPAKRAQVPAACVYCRAKKTKCDALRPCTPCTNRHIRCCYETETGETPAQAAKRKHNEAAHELEVYQQLFRMIGNQDERSVADIVRWIRSGHNAGAIVQYAGTSDALPMLDPEKFALQTFLIELAHSTGSLQRIIELAVSDYSDPSLGAPIPSPQHFKVLRNRVAHLSYIETLLRMPQDIIPVSPLHFNQAGGSSSAITYTSVAQGDPSQDNVEVPDLPPHEVPAAPWTTITADDAAVSHLISLFLTWINPTWRFVETDIFLKVFKLMFSQLQSEHDLAHAAPNRDRVSRGQHFHEEALRLWALEEGHVSLTNIQALCILALECNYRAEDTLGLSLVPVAVKLERMLPLHVDGTQLAKQQISPSEYSRVRLNTNWMARCTNIIMCIAFLSSTELEPSRDACAKIHDVFDDEVEMWTGYPLVSEAIAHRPTLYLRERCRLAELFQSIHALVLNSDSTRNLTVENFVAAVDTLSERTKQWQQRLPYELRYRWPMSTAVWELHASYLAFAMIFLSQARVRLQQQEASPTGQPPLIDTSGESATLRSHMQHQYLMEVLALARQSAQILQDFRERYGLKFTPGWLLELQAVAAGILVLDPELAEPTAFASPAAKDLDPTISTSSAAFDEVFRSLLGTGVQVMIARGVARMTYHTALEHKLTLSRSTLRMLQVMSDTAWRPSDVEMVKSNFPNFATVKGLDDDKERMSELLVKWETLEL